MSRGTTSSREGAPAVILAIAVTLVGAVALVMTSRGDGTSTPPVDVGPRDGPSTGTSGDDATSLDPVNRRSDGATDDANDRDTVTPDVPPVEVTASDATTGERVHRFWVEADGFGDVTAVRERVSSDPRSGVAECDPALTSVLVHAPGYLSASVAVDEPRVSARLTRVASIVGRVVDGASAPQVRARVELEYLGPLEETPSTVPLPWPTGFDGASLRRTDDDGRYAFHALAPGHWRTRATAGSASQASPPIRVTGSRWRTSDHWLDEHVRLVVTVAKADGLPAEATRVMLTPKGAGDEAAVSGYTDGEGQVTLGPLTGGPYTLTVTSDDGTAEPVGLTLSDGGPSLVPRSVTLRERSADDGSDGR